MEYHLVLDTNVYLHFKLPDQINWWELLEADESASITILVPPVVLSEIDTKKDQSSRSKLRDRAKKAQRCLERALEGEGSGKKGIRWEFLHRPVVDFEALGLMRDVPDDHLIATCIEFLETRKPDNLILITNDIGPRLNAKRFGLRVLKPAEGDLQPEDSDDQKKIAQLQRENTLLKSRLPNLTIRFSETQDAKVRFNLEPHPAPLTEAAIEEMLDSLKQKFPAMKPRKSSSEAENEEASIPAMYKRFAGNSPLISEEEYQRYENERQSYFKKYATFMKELDQYEQWERLTFPLSLEIINEGTAPGEDIDIHLHLPDGLVLKDEERAPPFVPEEPLRPQSPILGLTGSTLSALRNFNPINYQLQGLPMDIYPSNVSDPDIRRTNSYDVDIHVGSIKQHTSESLKTMWFTFESDQDARSFEVECTINCVNLPCKVKSTLHVIIEH